MSRGKADEVDELVVVEIKKSVWRKWRKGTRVAGSVCERCIHIFTSLMELTSLGTERLMLPTPPLTIQNPLAYGATGPSCPAQRTPQRLPLLDRIPRVSIGTMHLHERLYVRPESNPTPRFEP